MNKILLLNDPNYFGSLLMMLIENYIFDIYKINSMINEGDFVIDAGANIGIFTILAAKKVGPHGLVVAIEPENKNYEILLKNIEQHELNNIITVKKGLWNTSGTLQLHISDNRGAHSLIDMENYIQNQEIDVITIDDLKKSLKIQNISFIKMDIEGAEIEALKGATETLNQNNLFLVIAAYHIRNGNQTCSIISKDLNMHNFDIISDQQIIIAKKRWIKQKKSNKNNLI
jgi:FkbM family methyltransferase